ncbi:MAG TPA: ATP-binding protein [Phototrophicaceae bacterium]|nr:ATP-binding protein [Phototrophicaceae bacterium]
MKFPDLNRLRLNRLQNRLTALILTVSIVLLAVTIGLVVQRARTILEENADAQLRAANQILAVNTKTWLDLNIRALNQLVSLPDVVSMEPARQKPILQAMQAAYSYMYLVSTTNLAGLNVTRNDDQELKDYQDRDWFKGAVGGAPVTLQSLVGRTAGAPALVASAPIKNETGEIVGVGMFAADLVTLSAEVQANRIGQTGYTYLVDDQNRLIGHPDTTLTQNLSDFSTDPAIAAARGGQSGLLRFTDTNGVYWRAYAQTLANGWIVVVRQQESELLTMIYNFQLTAIGIAAIGLALLVTLSAWVIHRAIQPVSQLTAIAVAIANGDFSQEAPIATQDEIGTLAQAFNTMTHQLQNLIKSLEERIVERTAAMREAKEASRLKDEFLSIMSHELHTPLNAIIGYLGIMNLQGGLTPENQHMTQRARANAERLLALINDVLDISRIESGRLQLAPSDINLRDLLDRLQRQMAVLAEEKGLGFSITVEDTVPPTIHIDEDAITKIITNLLGNAFKFTEAGAVKLAVKRASDNLIIAVSDTGVGIPPQMHEVIFERFRQVDGSSKRAYGGSGLGLAIVKNLCSALNGKIQVQSAVKVGSTFTVTLPLQPVGEEKVEHVTA